MPELLNFTPFPNFRYYSSDAKGEDFGVVIVKATLQLDAEGRLVIAEEQAPLMFTDACHGEVNVTSLWHPSDLVPNKPRTDVIVNAVARTPDGVARASWPCGLRISRGGAVVLEKRLVVTGPRRWEPVWKRALDEDERKDWRVHRQHFERWALSTPEPVASVPLRYELAYGGLLARGLDDQGAPIVDDIHENPIGRGWIDAQWTDHTQAHPAPQIESGDDPIREPYRRHAPQSLGPIPCAWEPRLPRAGTYDQTWIDTIWPNWAPDYDFFYHNSAHPDLIAPGYLIGDETIALAGLSAGQALAELRLPGMAAICDFVRSDGSSEPTRMHLDTLFLDIADEDPGEWRVFLSWRANFAPDVYAQAAFRLEDAHAEPMEAA
jgi:hypothetical protein